MRIILCFLLALVAAPTWAEWVEVGETDSMTLYIDPDRIRKNGSLRKVWEIHDLKQPRKDGAMSRRALSEYDCKEEQYRNLAISTHSEPMAGGKTLWSDGGRPDTWNAIAPDTLGEDALKFVCVK